MEKLNNNWRKETIESLARDILREVRGSTLFGEPVDMGDMHEILLAVYYLGGKSED